MFDINESMALAKSIARTAGIRVVSTKQTLAKPMVNDTTITIGPTTIYNHEEYMQDLHAAIGKVCKDNQFFSNVKLEGRQDTIKEILRDMTCDKYMHGVYNGRDRQLAQGYKRRIADLQENINEISQVDPIAAALLTAGNEIRGSWQGFNKLDIPEELKPLHDKVLGLKDDWLSLETEDDLRRLLNKLEDIEQEQQDDEQSGDDGDDSTSEESQDEQGEGSGSGENSSESEGEDGEDSDSPEGDGSGDDGESSEGDGGESGDSGDQQDGSSKDSGKDSGGPEQEAEGGEGPEGDVGGQGEDGEGDPSGTGEGSPDDHGTQGDQQDSSGTDQGAEDGQSETRGIPSESRAGYGDSGDKLRELGILNVPMEEPQPLIAGIDASYIPMRTGREHNHTVKPSCAAQDVTDGILREMEGFKLSQKVRKHLIAASQTRTQVGLRKGKLNASKISRMYANTSKEQPRMFKQNVATTLKTDIAITIMVDRSGSMREGGKYLTAAACAIAVSEVLATMDIKNEILCYTTSGYEIENVILKTFEERFVSRDRMAERFANGDVGMGANADGESIMWGATRLMVRPEPDKLMLVFSDGRPAYSGGIGNSHKYLKDVVGKIEEAKGVDILGIGIKSSAVESYYKRSKVLWNLDALEEVVINLLKEKIIR